MPTEINWERLNAIELLSDADRQVFADRLALELLKPRGMEKLPPADPEELALIAQLPQTWQDAARQRAAEAI